jgi:peptidoglycan biosynthesis protein MviN/MurJ (putative lipid II flippase)
MQYTSFKSLWKPVLIAWVSDLLFSTILNIIFYSQNQAYATSISGILVYAILIYVLAKKSKTKNILSVALSIYGFTLIINVIVSLVLNLFAIPQPIFSFLLPNLIGVAVGASAYSVFGKSQSRK